MRSSLASCRQPLDDLTRGNDGNAVVAADGQQMLAMPGDDQFGAGVVAYELYDAVSCN